MLEQFCLEYYGSAPSIPPQILVPKGSGDTSALEEFLSEGGEDRVEVIHEALLASWPRLVRWQREDAENVRLRDQLRSPRGRSGPSIPRAEGLWRPDC